MWGVMSDQVFELMSDQVSGVKSVQVSGVMSDHVSGVMLGIFLLMLGKSFKMALVLIHQFLLDGV